MVAADRGYGRVVDLFLTKGAVARVGSTESLQAWMSAMDRRPRDLSPVVR